MMLNFYGMQLKANTCEVERTVNYKERFENLLQLK